MVKSSNYVLESCKFGFYLVLAYKFAFIIPLFGWYFINKPVQNTHELAMVEICDNGKDDDRDGFIDLNDTSDCKCKGIKTLIIPASNIPNPSFENYTCCPDGLARLDCAVSWRQASVATSDYFHTCDFDRDRDRGRPPTPLPAGNGYVGFLDLPNLFGTSYKEYIGACLNKPMKLNKQYTLKFYLGFGISGDRYGPISPYRISFYGTTDCVNLPFGDRNFRDCPSKLPTWEEIFNVRVTGNRQWVQTTVQFTANKPYAAIAIGPPCTPTIYNLYYFLDDLILAEAERFESLIFDISGNPCKDSVLLMGPDVPIVRYQWYKNGIAINGATKQFYNIPPDSIGNYQLMISDGQNCQLSNLYQHKVDSFTTQIDTTVCKGEPITVGLQQYFSEGSYVVPLRTQLGCDSIVYIQINHKDTSRAILDTTICAGNYVELDKQKYFTEGNYLITYSNISGCDSIVELHLQIANDFKFRDTVHICAGSSIIRHGVEYNTTGSYTTVFRTKFGCDSSFTVDLFVEPNFQQSIFPEICNGDVFAFNNQRYTTAGTYVQKLTSQFGCDSIIEIHLKVNPSYQNSFDTIVCPKSIVTFGNQSYASPGVYAFSLKTISGCDSNVVFTLDHFQEYTKIIDTIVCPYQVVRFFNTDYNQPGNYSVVSNTQHGCDSTVFLRLQHFPLTQNTLEIEKSISCNAAQDGVIKSNQIGGKGPFRYAWSNGNASPAISQLRSGSYRITITDAQGCFVVDSIYLDEPEQLQAEFLGDDPTCKQFGNIALIGSQGGTMPYVYTVNGKQFNQWQHQDSLTGGRYAIRITDAHYCTLDTVIDLFDPSLGAIEIQNVKEYVLGDSVDIALILKQISNFRSIQWSGVENGFSCQNCTQTAFRILNEITDIQVILEDNNECTYTATIRIRAKKTHFFPNAFSPNDDNINDRFFAISNGSIELVDKLEIYDRWGELVFAGEKLKPNIHTIGWDGTFRGKDLSPGVYVYVAHLREVTGKIITVYGDVTLIR